MKTGLSKKRKTTSIFFDESSPIIEVCTYNTDLKNRPTSYAERFPDLCKSTDSDEKTGYKVFEIEKARFSFRLTAPYSEERKLAASKLAKMIREKM